MSEQQKNLPFFEPNDADLIESAMAAPLAEKIKNAIGLLKIHQSVAMELSPDGYFVSYSGGKDSEVIVDLARRAGVKHRAFYCVTTIDPPELVRFIRMVHPEVEFRRPKKHLLTRLLDRSNGPPTRLARWCCAEYKETASFGLATVIGVRIAESARRAKLWRSVVPHRNVHGGLLICPIVYWTDADVWAYHRLHGLRHCELYDQGFKRLGCIGCPLAGPSMQAKEFARWPRYAAMWERAVKRNWEIWHHVPRNDGRPRYQATFASAQAFWDWWRSGKNQGEGPVCQGEFLFSYDKESEEGGAR